MAPTGLMSGALLPSLSLGAMLLSMISSSENATSFCRSLSFSIRWCSSPGTVSNLHLNPGLKPKNLHLQSLPLWLPILMQAFCGPNIERPGGGDLGVPETGLNLRRPVGASLYNCLTRSLEAMPRTAWPALSPQALPSAWWLHSPLATGSEAWLDKHLTVASGDHGLGQASQESLALGGPIEVSASVRFSTSLCPGEVDGEPLCPGAMGTGVSQPPLPFLGHKMAGCSCLDASELLRLQL